MKQKSLIRLIAFSLLFSATLVLTACGPSGPEPTPTPTKTPAPAETARNAVVEVPPTNTPVPIPPTATPAPALPTNTPIPQNVGPYTGQPVDNISRLSQRPIFICVNNDPVGRSAHYGLQAADLVYEYIVDGFTTTRLSALYQANDTQRVGPVRSARMPNIWMTYMYDGVLACSGGSDEIRYLLKNEVGFPYLDADIDDPSNNVYFFNTGTDYRTRLQINPEGVRRWLTAIAGRCNENPGLIYCQEVFNNLLGPDGNLTPWNRGGFQFSETPQDFSAGEAQVLRMPYPGGNGVEWRYDPARNVYLRFQGGQPHIDNTTGQQIAADNVIAMVAEHALTDIVEDSLGTLGVNVDLYGFGDFRIFRDGRVYEGTWRASDQSPPRWLGPGEQIVSLKPGSTWIQVVQNTGEIGY